MADQYYEKRLREALKTLQDLQTQELEPLNEPNKKKVAQPADWFRFYSGIYISYLGVYRVVEDCYHNMSHPQKRAFVKDLLLKVVLRFLEIKRDLISFNVGTPIPNSEFVNLDDTLLDLKMQPDVLDVKVPRFYLSEPETRIRDRNAYLVEMIREFGNPVYEQEVVVVKDPEELNMQEAIKLIATMERGRQGIDLGLQKKEELLEVFKKQQRQRILAEKGDKDDFNETDEAIIIIQKYLRGFQARREIERMRTEEERFFGLKNSGSNPAEIQEALRNLSLEVDRLKATRQAEFGERVATLKQDILDKEGLDIRLEMLDERRKFIISFYEEKEGKELPPDEQEFYARNDKLPPLTQAQIDEKKKEEAAKEKAKAKGDKGDKKAGKKETEAEAFLREHQEKGPAVSLAFGEIQKMIGKYNEEWSELQTKERDHLNNDLIIKEVLPQIKKQIETDVDKVIKTELESLYVKLGIAMKKKPKVKPPKLPKPKKLPGEALTGNREPKDLVPPLIETNILKVIPPVFAKDFVTTENWVRKIQEMQSVAQPDPSLAQLLRTVTEQVTLPLATGINVSGNQRVYLFYGPPGTGKTMMAHIVANEANALFLDISPEIIGDAVNDKNAISRLMFSVFRVAKEYQPAVIYVDEAEHFFPKKSAKKFKPRCVRFKKDLTEQIAKHITPEDNVAVVFVTSQPGLLAVPELKKVVKKSYYFPFPDYAARSKIFRAEIERHMPTNSDQFVGQTLALHSEGYSYGAIKQALEMVFSKARVEKLDTIVLTAEEIILPLSKQNYTSAEDYAAFKELTNLLLETREKLARLEEAAKENQPTKGGKPKVK